MRNHEWLEHMARDCGADVDGGDTIGSYCSGGGDGGTTGVVAAVATTAENAEGLSGVHLTGQCSAILLLIS